MYFDNAYARPNWFRAFLKWIFRLSGWNTEVIRPKTSKYLIIGAPHTSNWDFLLMLFLMAIEAIPIRWLGKHTLFRGPLGVFMRSVGGIPVNRSRRTKMVDQMADLFAEYDDLVLGVAPEGTRKRVTYWKTGFYYIALKAQVPIVMAYLDYENKVCGVGPSFIPSGDIEADFEIIRDFYSGIKGKHPKKQGIIDIAHR